ncbi:MAG: hypothetical protein NZ954_05530 [Thermofilaceae archaeon]|nr:hypothetical protein [Thermofilaceae archaeon]MCX8180971.1 hypothetical protein [Thermofilaceae archaeon]MDW8004076.1 hypothetical protein [Thermofilaceae archaeon]
MGKGVEVKAERVLTPPLLLAVIALIVVSQLVCAMIVSISTVIRGWFIGPIYIILILELLGRRFSKFRLKPVQLFLILLPLWYAAGKAFMITGAGGEGWGDIISVVETFRVRALADPTVRTLSWDLTPSLIAPKNLELVEKAWRGLIPGEYIEWISWIPSTVYWGLWLVVTTLIIVALVYAVVGPHTVEVERLVYPMSVPTTVLLTSAGTWIESKGRFKSKLFDVSDVRLKIFWVSFALGAVFLSLIPMIMEVLPIVPILGAGLWGEIPIPLYQFTAATLPGAGFHTVFIIHQAILMTLLPYDALVTPIITWIVFYVIYTTLGVRLGFLPYEPGSESQAHIWFGMRAPFPMAEFGSIGLTLGLGLLTLWEARNTIPRILKGEIGGNLPFRQLLYLFFGLFALWLTLWTSAGANPLMMTYFFMLFILWQISIVRYYAEIWWHPPTMETYYLLIWPVGASIGAWANVPSQSSQALYIQNMALVAHGSGAAFRQIPYNMGWIAHTYKWAHDLNANLKDVLLMLIAVAVVGWPLGMFVSTWWMHHVGGYTRLNYVYNSWAVDMALNQGIRGLTHYGTLMEMPFWYHGLLAVVGIFTVFSIHFLRMRFAWFIINPTALAATLWLPHYMWSASLAALIAKYLGNKVFGARKYEEYAAYVAAGLCWGLGSGYLIAGLYDLFLNIIPKFRAFYVP